MRILVVEDHFDTLDVVRRILSKQGYVVETASTLAGAKRLCMMHPPDVVIADIRLPDGDAWELPSLARQYGAAAIAHSGLAMADDIERSKKAGFAAHLIKPVSVERLVAAIQSATRRDDPAPLPPAIQL